MSDIVRYAVRSRRWRAWVGDLNELGRIATIFQKAGDAAVSTTLAHHRKDHDGNKICGCSRDVREMTPRAELTEGPDTLVGPVEAIVAQVDRRTFRRMVFVSKTSNDAYSLTLSFDARLVTPKGFALGEPGLSLDVSSSDQEWARQTFAELSDEIDKGAPRWQFMRSVLAVFVSAMLGMMLSLWIFGPLSRAHPGHSDVFVFAGIALGLAFPAAVVWAFPRLEILHEGAGSTAARRVSFLVGLGLSVPIGVLVNLLT